MAKKKDTSAKQSKSEANPPQKPATILALKRPSPPPVVEKSVIDEVIPSVPAAKESVVEKALSEPVSSEKFSDSIDSSPAIDSVPKSNDLETKSKDDLLIGTFVDVIAPWGAKVSVEIVDTYVAPSGDKWVCFNALDEIPDGWKWSGGVKKISSIAP